jgi:uncharacterized repeat protein (TIGR02543 family)
MNRVKGYFLSLFMIFAMLSLVACSQNPIKVDIIFDSNGGTDLTSVTYDETLAFETPENPTKNGYLFDGWFFDDEVFETPFSASSIKDHLDRNDTELVIYAKWIPIDYTITYELNEGINNNSNPNSFNMDSNLSLQDPTKEGYTFVGWYADSNFSTLFSLERLEPVDLTLYAKWDINTYTLQFVDENNNVLQSEQYQYGSDLSAVNIPIPTKEGHTFSGWDQQIPLFMPASNVTITAQFEVNQYTITFDSQGGSFVSPMTKDFESVIEKPVDPVKEGYTFLGWYTDLDDSLSYQFSTMPAEDLTLYAKWSINTYSIHFIDYDDSIIKTIDYEYQETLNLEYPEEPSRVGYTFIGWQDIEFTTMPAQNLLISAVYTINQYTITYHTNGGSIIQDTAYDYNAEVLEPESIREGYSIEGWYLDEALTESYTFTTMPAENITLYAKWEIATYTITYHLDGGINSSENIETFNVNTENFIYGAPTKEGHTFEGWYLNSDFSGDEIQYFVLGTAEHLVLYAKWSVNPYDIYYYIDENYDPLTSITLFPGETIVNIFMGGDHSAALTSMNRLLMWGNNDKGQLGDGTKIDKSVPFDITNNLNLNSEETIVSLSLGYSHASALTSLGRVFTWGSNAYGQLGDNTFIEKSTPKDITALFALGVDEKIISISLNGDFSSALSSTGRMFTWGRNNYYQLGDGTSTNRNRPTNITSKFSLQSGEFITNITLGGNHSAALTSIGRVFTWGWNLYGQLGDTTYSTRSRPTDITTKFNLSDDETVKSIYLGENHSAAITSSNRVFTWGNNTFAQLGDETTANKNRPTDITLNFDLNEDEYIENMSLGNLHTSAFSSLGRVFTWGSNTFGQLGDETTTNRNRPTDITLNFEFDEAEIIEFISLGSNHSSILTSTNRMFTWGKNLDSQLGDQLTIDRYIPIEVETKYPNLSLTETYDYGSLLTPFEPIKEGYQFSGWYTNIDMSTLYVFDTMTSNDITLIGYWETEIYTITYHLDGGTNSELNPDEYTIESDEIPLNDINKEGYTFLGWYDNENYTGDVIVSISKGSIGDIHLYAKWDINTYTLTFEEYGGSEVDDITADFNTLLTEPEMPIRQGYQFDGWYTDPDLTEAYTITYMDSKDITLYAKWEPKLTIVTFVYNNGNEDELVADYSGNELLEPTYDGYKFGGWYYDEALTEAYESDTFPTFNTTLYAKWHVAYLINYHLNGGTNHIDNPLVYIELDPEILLEDPTKEGYSFLGWYDNLEFSGEQVTSISDESTGDITLYAKWVINSYEMNYYIYDDYDPLASMILYPGETILSVSLGRNHSALLTSKGRIFTWGDNKYGQLGDQTTVNKLVPVDITAHFNLEADEKIIRIALGDNHSAVLTSNGRVFTWGINDFGQLGNDTKIDSNAPIDITTFIDLEFGEMITNISLGRNHTAAITSMGRMFTWGDNRYGQLGNNTTSESLIPIDITSEFGLTNGETIVNLSLGRNHTAAITSTGRIFTWGENSFGRLGDGTTISKLSPTDITSKFDLTNDEIIEYVVLGELHSAALTSTGRLFVWGNNTYGQLGDGTTTHRALPTHITNQLMLYQGEKIEIISLGSNHSAAITSLGRIFVWGNNTYGQLGDSTSIQKVIPLNVTHQFTLSMDETILNIELGANHSSVTTNKGEVFLWGINEFGQLGDGTLVNKSAPIEIEKQIPYLSKVEVYDFGFPISAYQPVKEGYEFIGWYIDIEMTTLYDLNTMPATDMELYARWEINQYDINYFIYPNYDPLAVMTLYPDEIIEHVVLGDLHGSALTSFGRIFTWGWNAYGQLGDGTSTNKSTPVDITDQFTLYPGETIESISLGSNHSAAITSLGRMFVWGANGYGQLGDQTIIQKNTPVDITDQFDLEVDEIIVDVSLGYAHTSAVTSEGRIFTWGWNIYGQLGDGTSNDRLSPTEITDQFNLVQDEKMVSTSLGTNHSAAITSEGRIFTWGWNFYGQIGDGTTSQSNMPIDITYGFTLEVGEHIQRISLGDLHSTALTSTGRMFTWGANIYGQLGDGTNILRTTPTEITNHFNLETDETIENISSGSNHVVVLTSLSHLFVFGYNDYGQLGDSTTTHKNLPVNISSAFNLSTNETIKSVSLGSDYSSVLTSSGYVYTWGANTYGQLAIGTTNSKLTPYKTPINYALLVKTDTYDYGEIITVYAPTKVGSTISGWYLDYMMTTLYQFVNMPASDLYLYGYWIPNS